MFHRSRRLIPANYNTYPLLIQQVSRAIRKRMSRPERQRHRRRRKVRPYSQRIPVRGSDRRQPRHRARISTRVMHTINRAATLPTNSRRHLHLHSKARRSVANHRNSTHTGRVPVIHRRHRGNGQHRRHGQASSGPRARALQVRRITRHRPRCRRHNHVRRRRRIKQSARVSYKGMVRRRQLIHRVESNRRRRRHNR